MDGKPLAGFRLSYTDLMSEAEQRATAQPRTPRAIGIEHMIDATIRLLQDRTPDQITVRDVALAAGHHHRFVQAWFGGKVGLLRAAFDRLLEDTVRGIPTPFIARDGFPGRLEPAARVGR